MYKTEPAALLDQLLDRYPLPDGIALHDPLIDSLELEGQPLGMAGLAAEIDGKLVTGSAATLGAPPVERAFFELLERLAVMAAYADPSSKPCICRDGETCEAVAYEEVFPADPSPELKMSLSNGVALHSDRDKATIGALYELAERDRVLRCFYGEAAPVALPSDALGPISSFATHYELLAYRFGSDQETPSVAGVFGFPRTDQAPLICGFGAGPGLPAALATAERECLQRLAFLWGEEIPTTRPEPGPTAGYHQEAYLWPGAHGALRDWLRHGHDGPEIARAPFDAERARFADLTPAFLRGRLHVLRALVPDAQPLRFGLDRSLPERLRVHPIA